MLSGYPSRPSETHKLVSRHRITFAAERDLHCAVLGTLGFSTEAIARETELTPGQVNYRLHKAKVDRAGYRAGTSRVAQAVMRRVMPEERRRLKRELPPQYIDV